DKAVRIMLGGILGVVALSMVTYLIPSGWTGGGGPTDSNVIATVGDYTVTTQEAQRVLSNMMRGRNLPPEILNMYAPQMINNLIGERAMAYEARRLGFQANETDTAESIRHTLPQQLFKDGKLISKDLYAQVLGEQGLTIEEFEKDAAEQVLINRLRDYVAASVVVSPLEVEQEFRKRNEKAKVEYVLLPTAKYTAEAQVSDTDMHAYFDKHRSEYNIPEKRSLAVLVIDPTNLQNEIQPNDAELQALYRATIDKFQVPERVKVRHILLKSDATNDKEVKAKIDDLEKQLKSGADFAELAKKNSQDPGSAVKGGDLDWVVRGQTVKEFEAAAFSLPLNTISQPIKTTYGYHILEVTAKEPARTIPFEEAKPVLIGQMRQRQVNDLLQSAEDKAVAALRKEPTHPDLAAAASKAQLFNVASYAPGDPIPGVGMEKDVDTAIAGLKKGQISQPVVLKGNKIVIVDVMDVMPSRPATFEDVQGQIRTKLNADKLQEVLTAKANELLAKAKSSNDLKKAAKEMGLEVKTPDAFTRNGAVEGAGSASTFADAFSKPVNSLIGPYAAQGSQLVAQIVDHVDANMAEFPTQRDSIRDEIRNLRAREREEIFSTALRKRLEAERKIKVNNDVVKQVIASYTSRS
ncbi:MAG TPA: peptidylprolyl isomerase, partial [Bryobacteraceae bacterium]